MVRTTRQTRLAFTLVELVLSMVVLTIVLGGVSSAMLLASRAVPDKQTALGLTLDAFHAADRLASELYAAQTITARTATSVTFTVADRNADGNPETIRYSWSGVGGEALKRQYNGGAAVSVLDDVREFALRFNTQTIAGASRVTVVDIALRSGTDAAARVDTSVQLLDQPL